MAVYPPGTGLAAAKARGNGNRILPTTCPGIVGPSKYFLVGSEGLTTVQIISRSQP